VTRAVTTLTHSRCRPISRQAAPAPRKQQRPAPPPAHPFLYPTMPINNPTPKGASSLPRRAAHATFSPEPDRQRPNLGRGEPLR